MSDELLIVLGHENDSNERISKDAQSRIEVAKRLIEEHPNPLKMVVITTGGFGAFNPSNVPHARLLQRAFHVQDLRGARIIAEEESGNTIENALGVRKLITSAKFAPKRITIVTSRYHLERVRRIFSRLLYTYSLHFESDESQGTSIQIKHERRALIKLGRELVQVPAQAEAVEGAIDGLLNELRHYDNVSYLPLFAAFSVIFIWLTNESKLTWVHDDIFALLACVALSVIFVLIYLRLTGTAASARRVANAWSYVLDWPHIGWTRNRAESYTWSVDKMVICGFLLAWIAALCFRLS